MGEAIDVSIDDLTSEDQSKVSRRKKRPQKYLVSVEKRGICYLSRVPPHMDPGSLRQILSKHGEIQRIYLIPEDPTIQVKGKKVSGLRGKQFSEGWVEFAKKSIAKRVARMLNGEQIGGRRRSSFYYDIWNIKYLSKFKWEDMTNEIANKNHTREQKLAMELSAAKRERDFYMSKVDQSHALDSIKERFKKKQKIDGTASNGETATVFKSKFVRHFPQNKPVSNDSSTRKPHLSSDVLAGVFTASS